MRMIAWVGFFFALRFPRRRYQRRSAAKESPHGPLHEVRMQRLQPASPFSSARVGLMAMIATRAESDI